MEILVEADANRQYIFKWDEILLCIKILRKTLGRETGEKVTQ